MSAPKDIMGKNKEAEVKKKERKKNKRRIKASRSCVALLRSGQGNINNKPRVMTDISKYGNKSSKSIKQQH